MRNLRGLGLAVAATAAMCLAAAPAGADVRAFRVSDGSEDPAFVQLGGQTTVQGVVADGRGGVYLVGSVLVGGGRRPLVHLRADGEVDDAFRPRIDGRVHAAAIAGERLAIAGSFKAVDGARRIGVAVVDARTGRLLPWTPRVPRPVPSRAWGDVALSASNLVVSAQSHVYGWRRGGRAPSWQRRLSAGELPAALVAWRGSLLAIGSGTTGGTVVRLNAATGAVAASRLHAVAGAVTVGDELLAVDRGVLRAPANPALAERIAACGRGSGPASGDIVSAFTGDAETIYAGVSPVSLDEPRTSLALVACPLATGTPSWSVSLPWGSRGPVAHAVALVGDHVMLFRQRL
jgi:hypothetical protein